MRSDAQDSKERMGKIGNPDRLYISRTRQVCACLSRGLFWNFPSGHLVNDG